MAKTHWKKLSNPNYLGAYSIEDGKDIILTIKVVRQESVVGSDGKKDDCTVCYWQEDQKPMILNATNCKTITKLLGSPYIEDWAGHKVQIGIEKVRAFGDVVDALRIRKNKPVKTDNAERPIACEECGKTIHPAFNLSASQLAEYTKKTYQRCLCSSCAQKAKQAAGGESKS